MLSEAQKAAFLTALRQQMEPAHDVLADEVDEVLHGSAPAYTTDAATPPAPAAPRLQSPE